MGGKIYNSTHSTDKNKEKLKQLLERCKELRHEIKMQRQNDLNKN